MRQTTHIKRVFILLLALTVAALVFALSRPAAGQGATKYPADRANGQRLAETLCVACHTVGSRGPQTTVVGVPSFDAIANHSGQSAERLAGAIILPHPPMPAVQLTNAELRDIIGFILSLRGGK